MNLQSEDNAKVLAEDGIIIIEDYFDEELCDKLFEEISSKINKGNMDVVEGGTYDYYELSNWDGAVATKRTGKDDGMIDVFNIDSVIPEIESFKTDENINDLINTASSEEYTPDNVNVYWNNSVTGTRDFHADTYSGKFKSFVYLTDVPDRSYGPFTYIKGSHQASKVKTGASAIINKIKNNRTTDAVFYDDENVVHCTAEKGTLIIANQGGYHRGHPQEEGRERMLVTTSYTPK